ncbi:unnamed protein product [Ambrosiozyma monospora]|uniref:Unnamed protein product n=1 Tax=Ambrosiozyma monospora TaxID=43982 RepID=A0ACB5TYC1_AMBMO|nr:unnamed protein product [Ambrosiozyma monospora]
MDVVGWSQDRYEEIKDQLTEFLTDELKYVSNDLIFLPASGYLGDNIVKKSKNLPWYSGSSLIELLESENKCVNHKIDKKSPFVMTINDVLESSKNDELTVSGRINSGLIQPGESISISPSQQTALIHSITITKSNVGSSLVKNESQKLAIEGEFVELKLKKLDNWENIKVGDLCSSANNPIKPCKKFSCELQCFELTRLLLIGTPFVMFRNNISIPARLSSIELVNGKKNKKKHLRSNTVSTVTIEILERDMPLLTFGENKKLGRVVIRKDGFTVAAGKILELLHE